MRKTFHIIIVLVLIAAILSTSVIAGQLEWTLKTVEGRTVNQNSFSEKTVVVVFSYSDNSLSYRMVKLVQSLIDADWPAQEDIQVIIADVNENSAEDIETYFFPYFKGDKSNLLFTVDDDDGGWNLLNLAIDTVEDFQGGMIPLCAIIHNNQFVDAWESNMEITEIEEKLENQGISLIKNDLVTGDVNGDGIVNADDLTALARHLAKIDVITSKAKLHAGDANQDGVVTSDDLTHLAKYVAKIIPSL